MSAEELRERFDAVVLATGSRVPRDLPVPGRELDGVHFAMDYLYQRNRWVARELGPEPTRPPPRRRAGDHARRASDVIVIGGGDTGADCVGNALREGARSVDAARAARRAAARTAPTTVTPWPRWPLKLPPQLRDGGGQRRRRAGLLDLDHRASRRRERPGRADPLQLAQPAAPPFAPVAGTERELPGRSSCCSRWASSAPSRQLLEQLGVERDARGNVKAVRPYTTSVDGVFAAGDARRGQSLIVWAINEGRQCARMVDRYLAASATGAGAERAARGRGPRRARRRRRRPRGPPAARGPGIAAGSRRVSARAGGGAIWLAPRTPSVPARCLRLFMSTLRS